MCVLFALLWCDEVPVKDTPSEDLGQHFNAAFEFIESAIAGGGRVLIHCFMGRSRSSTVVCAYLMRKHSMRLSEALQTLRATRPQVGGVGRRRRARPPKALSSVSLLP